MSIAKQPRQTLRQVTRNEALDAFLISLQIAALFITRLWQPQRYSDDAHIHFRCALNLSDGLGMVFNPGEWVLGTTSPFWTFMLGTLYRLLHIPIPDLAAWLNFGFEIGIMLLSLRWFRRAGLGPLSSHAAALLLTLEHWRMYFSSTGLELSLFILALMCALEALDRRNWIAFGLILGLIGWIRPEGSLVWMTGLVVLLLLHWREGRRISNAGVPESAPLRLLWMGYALAILIALCVAALLVAYYGSFLPQSMMAKSHAPWFQVGGELSHVMFFIRLGNLTPAYTLLGFQAIWGRMPDDLNSIIIAGVQVGLMVLGAWRFCRSGEFILGLGLLIFALSYYGFYAILQPPNFEWYYIPYFFVSLMLSSVGWHALIQLLRARLSVRWPSRESWLTLIAHLAFAMIMVCSAHTLAFHAHRSGRFVGEGAIQSLQFRYGKLSLHDKDIMYIRFAEQMRGIRKKRPEVQVACTEIGIFGYYFGGRVLDIFGLVSPEALDVTDPARNAVLPASCHLHPLNVWMAHRPEVIMSDWRWVPKLPPEFNAEYEESSWNDTGLAVFVRRDWASKIVVE